MRWILAVCALIVMLVRFTNTFAQSADCSKNCETRHTNCYNSCQVMGADNTGCADRCVKEREACLKECGDDKKTVNPDDDDDDDDKAADDSDDDDDSSTDDAPDDDADDAD